MRHRPVVVALVVAQVAVPVTMLVARAVQEGWRPRTEYPASWQMYTAVPTVTYLGRDAAGRTRRLDVAGLPLFVRAVDTGATVPDLLCERHPDLDAVVRRDGPDPGTFSC